MATKKPSLTLRMALRRYMDKQPRGVYDYHIAADLGMSPSMLSRVLKGERVPTSSKIVTRLRAKGIIRGREIPIDSTTETR